MSVSHSGVTRCRSSVILVVSQFAFVKNIMKIRLLAGATALACLLTATNSSFSQDWTLTSAPIAGLHWSSVASSADGSQVVATAQTSAYPGNGPIYSSADSGSTWTSNTFSPSPWQSIASSADGIKLIGSAGVVYTWTNSRVIGKPSLVALSFGPVASSADGSKLAAAPARATTADNSVFISTTSGATWTSNNVPQSNSVMTAWTSLTSSSDGNKLAVGNSTGSIYTSADGGYTWASNWLTKAISQSLFVASSADGNNLVAAAGGLNHGAGRIYVSTNSGATWMTSSAPILAWVSVASSADGRKLIAAAAPNVTSSNMIFTSSDCGFTWASNNVPAVGMGWSCVASSADGNKLVAGSWYGGIWTRQTTPEPTLNIAPSSNSLVVSWTVPSTDLVLQQNSDLSTANWVALTSTPTLNCTKLQNQVTVSAPLGSTFYRLISK